MNYARLCKLARQALPLMSPDQQAEAGMIIADLERTANALPSGDPALQAAAAAFEKDMRPVCEAIVSALVAGDIDALRGLRAMLPHLLADVNRAPGLANVLAFNLGKSFLDGLNVKPEETL